MERAYWHCIRIGQYSAPPHRHKFGSVGLQPSDMPANNRSIKSLIFVLVNHSPAEKKRKVNQHRVTPRPRNTARTFSGRRCPRRRSPSLRSSPSSLSAVVAGFMHVVACFLRLQLHGDGRSCDAAAAVQWQLAILIAGYRIKMAQPRSLQQKKWC